MDKEKAQNIEHRNVMSICEIYTTPCLDKGKAQNVEYRNS